MDLRSIIEPRLLLASALLLATLQPGCGVTTMRPDADPASRGAARSTTSDDPAAEQPSAIDGSGAGAEALQAELFRQAETDRAANLEREIERLQADLERAEAALVEAESGLAASRGRADAISALAVARIRVERADARAPWRSEAVAAARSKLAEAERQVAAGRFGAALFFVYRAQRGADAILREASQVRESPNAKQIRAARVNLRAGPSTQDLVLAVLTAGTPVIEQAAEGDWKLVQVIGGPAGWIHRQLLDALILEEGDEPVAPAASPRP